MPILNDQILPCGRSRACAFIRRHWHGNGSGSWQRSSQIPSAVLRISAASCPAPRCISGWSTSRSGTRKRKKHCWSWLPRTATLRGNPVGAQKPEAAGADDGLLPTSGRKGMEAGALGERFEKLIDKSHKKRYILSINALKKSVHRLGPHREPGAAENPAGYRRGTVTLEQKR